MKSLFKILSLLTLMSASAQQKNELKIDLFDALVLRTIDVSYEKILNDEASVGVSVFMNFEDKNKNFRYNEDFQLTPYFRQLFTTNKNFNVYGEVFGSFNFASTTPDPVTLTSKNYSDFALGLGTGLKRVSKNGYVIDVNVGLGRNMFNASVSRELVSRFGISLGKQF